jgi:steroid 5-alpha reductase family enzyme
VAALLYSHRPMLWLDYLGIGLAAGGLIFETLADSQLAAFRANPDNRRGVMDKGLWRWSRHPNYFGEAMLWWGFFLVGFSASHQYWLLLSPLLVTALLRYITGVSPMEESIAARRPGYADYRRRVSDFIPWPPKR